MPGSPSHAPSPPVLIHDCETVGTMDTSGTEIPGGSILIENGVITWVGAGDPPQVPEGTRRVDGRGQVAIPGLINTHMHLFQTLSRGRFQEGDLFVWLGGLYTQWEKCIDEEWVYAAALVGLSELALSGCTLTTDHHYFFPPGRDGLIEATVKAASEIGIRLHPVRSSMNLGQKDGALPPDSIIEDKDTILAESERLVKAFHDPSPGSMLQVGIGPCWPLNCSEDLMRESVELSRRLDVRMHTHIAEPRDEERLTVERYGRRPLEFLDSIGMIGSDVWLAHCVQLSHDDILRTAATTTGVAHCPSSNLRSGAGTAPVPQMLRSGVRVGVGVDSLALNDTGNLLAEARQVMLVHRANGLDDGISVRQALSMSTSHGADCLGRSDLGAIAEGRRGDVALFDVNDVAFVGAEIDFLGSLLLCDAHRANHVWVEGRQIVADGRLTTVDQDQVVALAREVIRGR